MARVILKPRREESILRRHPWVFSGAVGEVEGDPGPGEPVEVYSSDRTWLALAAWSPCSQIRLRVWSFTPGAKIDRTFLKARLERSLALRRDLSLARVTTGCRLVNAESDGMCGLVVDRYGDFLVCQFLSAGAEYVRDTVTDLLEEMISPRGIYERSDTEARLKEGLPPRSGVLRGSAPPGLVEITEHGARYLVDIASGHKTGFYLDQRDSRRILMECARDREVLNCFSYTGAFGVSALLGGARRVTNVDTSGACLEIARENARINGLADEAFRVAEADVFALMREFRDRGRTFDIVVLDPPKFASTAAQVPKASRGYKDINLLAFKLLKPGGILFTFSCSGHVKPELFQKIVSDAALDARREACVVRFLSQPPDHPVSLAFPEGLYLKGLVCTV